jgi:hypothetical protein
MTIEGTSARAVRIDGRRLSPRRSQRLFNHSPDGFGWGYAGSGPAQLALAILLAAGLSDRRAIQLHQAFKAAFVQHWPQSPFTAEVDVYAWLLTQPPPETYDAT